MSLHRKWLDALRSGKYRQTKKELRSRSGGYCCLGVLCDVSGMGYWNSKYEYLSEGDGRDKQLPWPVFNAIGIDPLQQDELIRMNDSGKRFPAIAKRLEEMFDETQPGWRNL